MWLVVRTRRALGDTIRNVRSESPPPLLAEVPAQVLQSALLLEAVRVLRSGQQLAEPAGSSTTSRPVTNVGGTNFLLLSGHRNRCPDVLNLCSMLAPLST